MSLYHCLLQNRNVQLEAVTDFTLNLDGSQTLLCQGRVAEVCLLPIFRAPNRIHMRPLTTPLQTLTQPQIEAHVL